MGLLFVFGDTELGKLLLEMLIMATPPFLSFVEERDPFPFLSLMTVLIARSIQTSWDVVVLL